MIPGLPAPERLFDLAPCGLLVADARGELLAVNDTLCNWLQRERRDLLGGQRFPDLLTMGGRIFHQTHIAPLLRMQGSVAEVKLELKRKDGRAIPVMINAVERIDGARVLLHVAVFQTEDRHKYERELLAQRQRAEALLAQHEEDQRALAAAQAQAQERALFAEQMVGIVSHDLRNPLGTITMSAALLRMGRLEEPQRLALQRIDRSTQRAERLISDLLDVTRARLGRGLRVRPAPVDLHEALGEAVAEWQAAFRETRIVHEHSGNGNWDADAERVVQAVGNLVRNATNYGDEAVPVTITSMPLEGAFHISVHNGGRPIAPELVPRLFEPMVRGNESDEQAQGVGLGLYIVSEIARAHGGGVQVTSSEEAGTRFTLVLGPVAR